MKVLLLTLLLVLLCSTQVLTLRCYVCTSEDDNICKTEADCAATAQYCKTYQKELTFTRTCEDFCAEDHFTKCCQEDLC
ncbi:lymphocyte antigen 6D [Anabas testudineus]|uniref:lymphocyte antigen 6D n=1 Tax=Anabas testudineus TaxID=64144 RepID=UPI000E4637D5|nr:lymphocyte antigen 6D [Anabas testudineus]